MYRAANGRDDNRHLAVLTAITNDDLDKNAFDLERLADPTDAIGRPPFYTVDFTDFRPRLEELLGVREWPRF